MDNPMVLAAYRAVLALLPDIKLRTPEVVCSAPLHPAVEFLILL